MKNEVFKDIPGYENYYQVSNLGTVKSLDRTVNGKNGDLYNYKGKTLKQGDNGRGYLQYFLCKNGIGKIFKTHQLVAMAFLNHIPNKSNKIVVDHINNIKTDNRLENLQLITQRHNASKNRTGTSKYTGVYWSANLEKWIAEIVINKKSKYLGRFDNEIEASIKYQEELKKL